MNPQQRTLLRQTAYCGAFAFALWIFVEGLKATAWPFGLQLLILASALYGFWRLLGRTVAHG